MKSVNVVNVLQKMAFVTQDLRAGAEIREACGAVSELIEAGKEFDQCDSREVQIRFRAALARVTGENA